MGGRKFHGSGESGKINFPAVLNSMGELGSDQPGDS